MTVQANLRVKAFSLLRNWLPFVNYVLNLKDLVSITYCIMKIETSNNLEKRDKMSSFLHAYNECIYDSRTVITR